MKTFSLSGKLLAAAALLFASCGGNEQKSSTEAVGTDTTAVATAPVSTIINTPQNMMIVVIKVADFAKWKSSYDGHDSMRLESGVHSYVVGRGVPDSNLVIVITKVDDTAKAKAFGKSPGLKEAMKKSGVVGNPKVSLVSFVYQDTIKLNTDLRSFTEYSVKDYDTWQKVFEGYRQLRTDNGILDRAYGHDAYDSHKIAIVVAVTDTAKAETFRKSDALKQKRTEAGITSEAQRFSFRVVQRY